jgi:hypothetical protein
MKYFLNILLSFCLSSLSAQNDIKIVDVGNDNYSYLPIKYAFENDGYQYFQTLILSKIMQIERLRVDRTGFVAFDKDLKVVKNFNFKSNNNKEEVLETFFSQGKIHLISVGEIKKEKIVTHLTYTNDGKPDGENKILTTDKKNEIEFAFSADSSKMVVYTILDDDSKKSNCKIQACVLDRNGNVLWQEILDLKASSDINNIKSLGIANNGSIYAVVVNFPSSKVSNFFFTYLKSNQFFQNSINCKRIHRAFRYV